MGVSNPTNFVHKIHVGFDPVSGAFTVRGFIYCTAHRRAFTRENRACQTNGPSYSRLRPLPEKTMPRTLKPCSRCSSFTLTTKSAKTRNCLPSHNPGQTPRSTRTMGLLSVPRGSRLARVWAGRWLRLPDLHRLVTSSPVASRPLHPVPGHPRVTLAPPAMSANPSSSHPRRLPN
jgi:hypothetical protein